MLTAQMKDLIATFPLGFVATVTLEGAPAVSPKGTFLVLDDQTIAYSDIRSPGTRRNLMANPSVEVNFVDPFRRIALRAAGTATVHPKGSDWFAAQHPQWLDVFGDLANRIGNLVEIKLATASLIWTPPYDDGATEDAMIALYKAKFAEIYP
jgi:hypothetical protein